MQSVSSFAQTVIKPRTGNIVPFLSRFVPPTQNGTVLNTLFIIRLLSIPVPEVDVGSVLLTHPGSLGLEIVAVDPDVDICRDDEVQVELVLFQRARHGQKAAQEGALASGTGPGSLGFSQQEAPAVPVLPLGRARLRNASAPRRHLGDGAARQDRENDQGGRQHDAAIQDGDGRSVYRGQNDEVIRFF